MTEMKVSKGSERGQRPTWGKRGGLQRVGSATKSAIDGDGRRWRALGCCAVVWWQEGNVGDFMDYTIGDEVDAKAGMPSEESTNGSHSHTVLPSASTHTYPRPPSLPAGHPLRFPFKKTSATNRSCPPSPPTLLPMDRLCGKPPSPIVRLEPSSVKLKSIFSRTFTRRGLTAHTQRAR